MKVYVVPADEWACGNYRMTYPAQALQASGHNIEIIRPGELVPFSGRKSPDGKDLENISYPPDADVIVIQRTTSKWTAKAIRHLRDHGVAVVVDVDDDLAHIEPNNPAFRGMHPRLNPEQNWQWLLEACRSATLVTISTQRLANVYAGHGRWAHIPNCIPKRFLSVPHEDSDVVGWAGAFHSHPQDPKILALAGQRLEQRGGKFLVVGPDEPGLQRALGLSAPPATTGVVPFTEWAEAVTRIGIGTAPLVDSRFNRAKSWLKPLEYSALRIPCVVSQLPEYLDFHWLHPEGCLAFATKPKEWDREIKRLVESAELRAEMAGRAYEVAKGLTIEGRAEEWWWSAWVGAREWEDQHG